MSFEDLRQQLNAARDKQAQARAAVSSAQEQVSRLKRERARLARKLDPESEADRQRLAALDARIERAEADLSRRRAGLGEITRTAAGIFEQFTRFTDPREMI